MADIHGDVGWNGAIAVESLSYTISHGISPGTAVLQIQPQSTFPDEQGDLTITDGNEVVVIPNCKIDNYHVDQDQSGQIVSLTIVDRRWKWRDLGIINGMFNQLDPHGKLLPWTIQSPTELAIRCLQAMGEVGYDIDMPAGINYPGPYTSTPIINTSGTNPPVNWVAKPPAQALQELCDQYGRRLVYQFSTDSVVIAQIGDGGPLPLNGSIYKQGPSIKSPETPDAIGVVGAPTRYQMLLLLEAVGLEWDGSYRPIAELSYAPRRGALPQISTATVVYDGETSGLTYEIYLGAGANEDTVSGVLFSFSPSTSDTSASIASDLAAAINGSDDLRISGKMTAMASGGKITITATKTGVPFQFLSLLVYGVDVSLTGKDSFNSALDQAAVVGGKKGDWTQSPPGEFPDVQSTNRLTYWQARELAKKSVWRCYQVVNVDASGKGGINVPGYAENPLTRRQQLLISGYQVTQIVPQPLDATLLGPDGRPTTVDFYAAYSKDKPAAVYGSVAFQIFNPNFVTVPPPPLNTNVDSQVIIPFSVDPDYQVITFSQPVYQNGGVWGSDLYVDPGLVLLCAVQVRDADTNQFDAYTKVVPLPGQASLTNPKFELHTDVQLNVVGQYDVNNNIVGVQILEADPIVRADYYLQGMALQYNLSGGQTIQYNGIRAIDLDGAIQQVSWSVGPGGCSTTASLNTEHNWYIPPYPARRRAEYLPPFLSPRQNLP
jgi:hypothetical protein